MLPDLDGLEVIKRLREWSTTPIVILSVRESEAEKVAARLKIEIEKIKEEYEEQGLIVVTQ